MDEGGLEVGRASDQKTDVRRQRSEDQKIGKIEIRKQERGMRIAD